MEKVTNFYSRVNTDDVTRNWIVPRLDSQATDMFTCKILFIFALTRIFLSPFPPSLVGIGFGEQAPM